MVQWYMTDHVHPSTQTRFPLQLQQCRHTYTMRMFLKTMLLMTQNPWSFLKMTMESSQKHYLLMSLVYWPCSLKRAKYWKVQRDLWHIAAHHQWIQERGSNSDCNSGVICVMNKYNLYNEEGFGFYKLGFVFFLPFFLKFVFED